MCRIDPPEELGEKVGLFISIPHGKNAGHISKWRYHVVVVYSGRVYDVITGKSGRPIAEYKMMFEDAANVRFGF